MVARYPMTVAGAKALREECHRLKAVERPRIIQALSEARAHGDLKENAEYHAAREQQSFNEGRIQELEAKLANAQVIDVTKLPNTGKVIFGCTVRVVNTKTDEEVMYRVVGEDESDIRQNKISITSPIARALIGKSVGDEVEVNAPKGIEEYEISEVEYI
ncbi:MAG: transcription elongation factor GreA [Gammaproteobacteria bacterium]